MRIQYNFVKLHMVLKGKHQAQEAKIHAVKENENKWKNLLELAIITNRNESN